ncbi:MAG TPA: addiction module protein [Thermoanaerobaculia bacterium]
MAVTIDEARKIVMELPEEDRQLLAARGRLTSMSRLEEVREEALRLTRRQRLKLAQELHASVMTAEDREIEQAWIDEAERRLADWKAGKTKAIPADEVIARLREKYGRARVRAGR